MGTAGLDYLQRLHTADPEHMSASRDQVGGLTLLFSSSASQARKTGCSLVTPLLITQLIKFN